MILAAQLVLCTLAAYAFARFEFRGSDMLFALVLLQLMIMPDVLIVENYRTMSALGLLDTILAIAPAVHGQSRSASSCCARPSRRVPQRARRGGARRGRGALQVLWKVYVPLARPIYLAYGAGLGELPLEQFPVAADHHQLGRGAAADRGPAGVLGAPETRASTGRSSRPRR